MAISTSTQRLRKEFRNISREPPQHITARPLASNILQWYFVLEGPKSTPYQGGLYLGRLVFPPQYPFKPPAVYMCTPQGRFKIEQRLCLSMSDFHPETWNPLWSVSAVLTGLLAFMLHDEDTVGSISTSVAEKRNMARTCHDFNRKHKMFRELFPEFVREPPAEKETPTNASGTTRRPNPHAQTAETRAEHRGSGDQDKESLPNLLGWLVVFVGVIYLVFRMIAST